LVLPNGVIFYAVSLSSLSSQMQPISIAL
jgi:hypothetical protein